MGFFSTNDSAIMHRLERIEAKLNAIIDHLDLTLPADGMDDIRALIAAGKKIEAIKAYRLRTGADLSTAKAAIDAGL